MDYGLIDLPQAKWGGGTGRQVILKGDFAKVEAAILQVFGIMAPLAIVWVDATQIKLPATADSPAPLMMSGFPHILHYGMMLGGGLTDGRYRENTAVVILDFDVAAALWGTEKVSQWYVVYALAGNADAVFTLKAMPYMRVQSQALQVISLGTLTTPATGIGYGFTTNELADFVIYVLTGASQGLMRPITANNNDNATGGTITYSGAALTLAAGDWLVVLPNTNFRRITDIFNNASGDIDPIIDLGHGLVQWVNGISFNSGTGVFEDIRLCSPLAREARATIGSGYSIGHPQVPYTVPGPASVAVSGSGYGTVDFAVEFCKYNCNLVNSYGNRVAYRT